MRLHFVRAFAALCLLVLSATAFAAPNLAIDPDSLQLVSSRQINRTVFEYSYTVEVVNTGTTALNVSATVTSTRLPITTLVEGTNVFGTVPAGARVRSSDTFTIRHDRTYTFDRNALAWALTFDNPPNTPPVANAGADQVVFAGQTVTLNGTASTDADGDPLSYQWTLIARPEGSTAVLVSATTPTSTFVADIPGTYEARLIVSDGTVSSAPDLVTIRTDALNTAPVANAGPDRAAVRGVEVQLDGTASSDADGDELAYIWSFVSRPAGSMAVLQEADSPTPTFTPDAVGDFVIALVVDDGLTTSTPDTVTVTTSNPNTPPVANAGTDQTVSPGTVVTLDGSGSSDVDGNPLSFQWALLSRPTGSNAQLIGANSVSPTFTADIGGQYVVQLIVNDGVANSPPDTVTITTTPGNSPPTARAGDDQTVRAGDVVSLDGIGSSDPDDDPLSFAWSLTSRPAASTATLSSNDLPSVSFTADVPGLYVAQLIVNDGTEASAPDTVSITAREVVPEALPDSASVQEDQSVLIPVLANDRNPLVGSLTAQIVSAPAHGTASIEGAAIRYVPAPDFNGADSFTYRVLNAEAASAPATVSVNVIAVNDPPVAIDDVAATTLGASVFINVLANDTDVDGDMLAIASFTAPSIGTAVVEGAALRYTPAPGFVGVATFTYQASDGNSGLSNSATVRVTITDTTAPTITPVIAGTQGNSGWYRSDVTVSWTVGAASPITSQSGCEPRSVTADTSGVTFTCSATSSGGTTSRSVTIQRDATSPLINVTAPAEGATYNLNDIALASFECTDATSGVASCAGRVASGAAIPTGTAGAQVFTIDATDAAGNVATVTRNYTVTAIPPRTITTYAGSATTVFGGDGGAATLAGMHSPVGIATDRFGNIFVADRGHHVVRRIDATTGVITTVAGTPDVPGSLGNNGAATSAQLSSPVGLAIDSAGNLFIADVGNSAIRRVDAVTGIITFVTPGRYRVAVDRHDNLYITRICAVYRYETATGILTTVAGGPVCGFDGDGGPATEARFSGLTTGIAVDATGNLFIVDQGNNRVRKVSAATGIVTTIAGGGPVGTRGDEGPATSAYLANPVDVAVDASGVVYIADQNDHRIREVTTDGVIHTLAGTTNGFAGDGGPAALAQLYLPGAVAFDPSGNLYIADERNARVRRVGSVDPPVNGAPVALDDVAETENGIGITINVLANDTDPNGDALTVQSFTQPTGGQVARDGNALRYTPNGVGDKCLKQTDSFSYTVTDGTLTDTARVDINFLWENQRPVAVASGPGPVLEGETIQLIGSGSSDADGDLISYHWRVIAPTETVCSSGGEHFTVCWEQPVEVQWSDRTSPNPTVVVPRPGDYVFGLQVSDCTYPARAGGLSAVAEVSVPVRDLPEVTVENVTIAEGNSGTRTMTFTVELSSAPTIPGSLSYSTVNGSAQSPSDFEAASGTLTFPVGSRASQTITVQVNGDEDFEPTETFNLVFSNLVNVRAIGGGATGTITNDDADPVTVLRISPSTVSMLTFAETNVQAQIGSPVPSVTTVGLSIDPTNVVQLSATQLTIPVNQTARPFTITSGSEPGTAIITATSAGRADAIANVQVARRATTLTFADALVGQNRSLRGTLTLANPAPAAGATFALTTEGDGTASLSTSSLVVPAGQTSATFNITGLTIGSVTTTAQAAGFTPAAAGVFVTNSTIAIAGLQPVGLGESANVLLTLSQAPANDLVVTLASADPSIGTISPAQVTVRAGQTQPDTSPLLTGVGLGRVTLTASASGYAPDTTEALVTMSISIDPPSQSVAALRTRTMNVRLSAPAPHDLEIALRSDNAATASVPETVTVPAGQLNVPFTLTGVAQGNTTIRASVPAYPDILAASSSINVTQPSRLCLSGFGCTTTANVRIGADLQWWAQVSLDVAPEPGESLTMTGTSSNPGAVLVSSVENAIGAAQASISGITSTSAGAFFLQALNAGQGGVATVTLRVPGYADLVVTVTVDPSGFALRNTDFTTNTSAAPTTLSLYAVRLNATNLTYAEDQELRGGLVVPVSITSSNTAVGTITGSPVAAQAIVNNHHNNGVGQALFNPVTESSGGTTTLSVATPAGFETLAVDLSNIQREVLATVQAPLLCITGFSCTRNATVRIGADLQHFVNVWLQEAPRSPVTLRATSNNAQAVIVSRGELVQGGVEAMATQVTTTAAQGFWLQALAEGQGGTTSVTFSAEGYADLVVTVAIDPSAFVIRGQDFTTNTAAAPTPINLYAVRLNAANLTFAEDQELRGGLVVPVTVTSSNTAVGTITTSPVLAQAIANGTSANAVGQTTFDPADASGTSTIAVVTPPTFETVSTENFSAQRDIVATVRRPYICAQGWGCTGSVTLRIGADLQYYQAVYLEESPGAPVVITATSPIDDSVIVSRIETQAGGDVVATGNVSNTTLQQFWIQALGTGQGTTNTVTFSAPGYESLVVTVTIDPSAFVLRNQDFTTNTSASPTTLTLWAIRLNPTTLAYAEDQEVRGGIIVPVSVTSSNPAVGVITTSPIQAQATANGSHINQVGQTTFDPNGGGTTTITVVPPPTFETIGTETSANQREITATVQAPLLCMSGFGCTSAVNLRIGADLQQLALVSLQEPPGTPVAITAESSSMTAVLVSRVENLGGERVATASNVANTLTQQFWLQALNSGQGGSATVTFRAPGYSELVATIQIDPSAFVLRNQDFQTNTAAANTNLNLWSIRLNPTTLAYADDQELRGGLVVPVTITSSNPAVGTVASPVQAQATVNNSHMNAVGSTPFDPIGSGTSTITVVTPPGFETIATETSSNQREIVVTVTLPRIRINGGFAAVTDRVGKDLQASFQAGLEVAPASPVNITVTSSNPSVVVVSASETGGGTSSAQRSFANTSNQSFWIHGLQAGASADVTLSAPGYESATIAVTVDPSGFVTNTSDINRAAGTTPVPIVLWAARLNPASLVCAELQEIRGGLTQSVSLGNSVPAVGSLSDNPLFVEPRADNNESEAARTLFAPLTPGTTAIEVIAPAGWSTPVGGGSCGDRFVTATVTP